MSDTISPKHPVPYAIFEFPVTLPSCLAVASVRIPIPMNQDDFEYFLKQISTWREALINPPGLKTPNLPETGKNDD